jgi:hypothetical protein
MSEKPPLTGIELDDKQTFRQWAESILPWLREVMADVAEGISCDIGELVARQERYTGYAGALVEIYAKAEAYKVSALAEAMEKAAKTVATSLVARVAEGECKNEIRVYEAIHRLNSTLTDQLVAMASRLKYEGALTWGQGGRAQTEKPAF